MSAGESTAVLEVVCTFQLVMDLTRLVDPLF